MLKILAKNICLKTRQHQIKTAKSNYLASLMLNMHKTIITQKYHSYNRPLILKIDKI